MIPDLNLLRVFDVLLEERSVTRAGARLGLSQSAVSHALGRLRHLLNDELFVRGPSGMQPTTRALEIGEAVRPALNRLQAAVAPAQFDPATSKRRFTLAAGAYASTILAPALAVKAAAEAPGLELELADLSPDVADLLDARQIDFALASVTEAPDRFRVETLMSEALCWVVSPEAPLAQTNAVDLQALAATPHILIARRTPAAGEDRPSRRGLTLRASWEDAGAFEAALARAGLTRRVAVTVPDTFSALAVASRSTMAALVPRRLALAFAQAGRLKLIEPPYESPPAPINLMVLRDRLHEPAIVWMRDAIRHVAQNL